ncbi:MAG: hypothetical protein K9N06_11355 [Candidatus Cloacimonetes bacterium]|nr:hypothetical protein [Candidatus Cloacimonadota bacterium]
MRNLLLILLLCVMTGLFAETLEQQEVDLIHNLLTRNGLRENSLDFLKDWSGSTEFKIPKMVKILNQPLEYPKFVDRLAAAMETEERIELLQEIMPVLAWNGNTDYRMLYENKYLEFEQIFWKEVSNCQGIVNFVEKVWDDCEIERSKAFIKCDSTDLELWNYLSTSLWSEPEDSLEYNAYYEKYGIIKPENIETDTLKAMIGRIDLEALFRTAVINKAGFDLLDNYLQYLRLEMTKPFEYESRYGLMRIGSSGDDQIKNNYVFIYDPAGNDSYLGRIETNWSKQPYFWVIDGAGDDYYHCQELAGLVSVKGGIGMLRDHAGDDVYTGGDYAVSAIWGYCELNDMRGNDIYSFGLHAAGAATYGICLLVDEKGRDSYHVTQYGEGFGSTLAFGAIMDYEGFDNYYAGGKYMHAPLAPLDYRSLSQGFGFGMRPDLAGGIGMIFDGSGNDNYTGGVYSQAVAYWYALGIIYDKEGYDYYDSVYYPQGSGIHLAGGFLFDGEGDDHYYSKNGPGQGSAHDWAVGFLIDRGGNDHYSVGGGNGMALTNSVVVFLDVSGDDNYQRKEEGNYGSSREARGTGGIGMFLDTGGNDKYPVEICANDTSWIRGYYGIGIDTLMVVEEKELEVMSEQQAAQVDSLAPIKEIWELAAGWGVGSNQKTVQRAGEILQSRGEESAVYIAENVLGTKDGLAYRAISEFTKKYEGFQPYLISGLASEDSLEAKNCISLLGEYKDSTLIVHFKPFLEADKYTNSVLGTLGDFNCAESVNLLKEYRFVKNEKRRFVTASSLMALKRDDSRAALLEMADDDSFLIRTMIRMMLDKEE